MEISAQSIEEWERLKKDIEDKMEQLKRRAEKIMNRAERRGWSSDKLSRRLGDRLDRASSLGKTLGVMSTLESSSQMYNLNAVAGELGGVTLDPSTNAININYLGATESFVHEVTHAGQFETGDIAFDKQSGRSYGQDLYDEAAAYQAQYAYSPSSVMGIEGAGYVNSAQSITADWVKGLKGGNIYGERGSANTGQAPININSGKAELIRAYSNKAVGLPDDFILRNHSSIYYKR